MNYRDTSTIRYHAISRSIITSLALLIVTLDAEAQVFPTEIGGIGDSGSSSAKDINDRGQVVGKSLVDGVDRPFSWTPEGGVVNIGGTPGSGGEARYLTENGIALGFATHGYDYSAFHAFYWTEGLGRLDAAPMYTKDSIIRGAAGESAIGTGCTNSNDCGAFFWSLDSGFLEIGSGCHAADVNRVGQVTGWCGITPFIWSAAEGLVSLEKIEESDACYAAALNDHGQVVGGCTPIGPPRFAFSWTADGGMVKIDIPEASEAYAEYVNNAGLIAGGGGFQTSPTGAAWAWSEENGVSRISAGDPTVTGNDVVNLRGLTEGGQVVGYATEVAPITVGVQYAFVWTESDGLIPLFVENARSSYPNAWNDNDHVVGHVEFDNKLHGFSWTPSGGMEILYSPPGENQGSRADAVNNRGQVVGTSYFGVAQGGPQRYVAALWNTQPLSRFLDIPGDYWAFDFIETLAESGVTAGCGNDNYCPSEPVTRAQMAVFLERGINGSAFSPPAATGTVFFDVGAGDFAAAFIEQLFVDGITAGCGNSNYCSENPVTRAQMAVFLLRAKHGADYSPPPAAGVFDDVPIGSFAANWIEQLAAEGITAGCGVGNYCPNAPVERDQMAVFLVRTFGL